MTILVARLFSILILWCGTSSAHAVVDGKTQKYQAIDAAIAAGNEGRAVQLANNLIKEGDGVGYVVLADLTARKGGSQGLKKRHEYLLKGSALGNGYASYRAYLNFQDGTGAPVDPTAAVRYLELAAVQQFPDALIRRGIKILQASPSPEAKASAVSDIEMGLVRKRDITRDYAAIVWSQVYMSTFPWKNSAEREKLIGIAKYVEETTSANESVIQMKEIIRDLHARGLEVESAADGSPEDLECREIGLTVWQQEYYKCVKLATDRNAKMRIQALRTQSEIDSLRARQEQDRQMAAKAGEAKRQDALLNLLSALANAGAPQTTPQGSLIAEPMGCNFSKEVAASGFYKTCVYKCGNGVVSKTINRTDICPMTP